MKRVWTNCAVAALVVGTLAACDGSTTTPGAVVQADVAFRATSGAAADAVSGSSAAPARVITVEGSNGTLELEELHVIVAEFELERMGADDCDDDSSSHDSDDDSMDDDSSGASDSDDSSDDDDCEEFEAPPAFVNVPLDDGEVVEVSAPVAPDTYEEIEFEIEDLDDDDEDGESASEILSEIRSAFPDWPDDASILVTGTYTADGEEPVSFRVYFEAEVEIELELDPPVTIADDGDPTFTVELNPGSWFTDGSGQVRNLAELDYDETGTVHELEVEVENGEWEVEFDD